MKWKGKLINHIIMALKEDAVWDETIAKIETDSSIGVHLAIFGEPFLSLVLSGEKTIESRFSINKVSPFMKVSSGDVILLKESGGPIIGVFIAGNVQYFKNLKEHTLREIEEKYGDRICSKYDKDFWKSREKAKYCSLIEIRFIRKLSPFKSEKKDKTGWSVIRTGISNGLFN